MGVKSLWGLLTPVGRPTLLENVEGKAMAIDSSIWIYQFQATMRDRDGRALVNGHVLGFLRRISKLLFYGIKPVFVFDGGAPALKRATLRERKEKKRGAAVSHAKLAEKLLAAQMRREALSHTDSRTGKGKAPALDDNTVYLEDVDSSMPKTPSKKKISEPSSSSKKKIKFHDHDPYQLPAVDLEEQVAKVTRLAAPDPRLATEDELRTFIEDMRPEDFDVTSPAFRELPTEVQYEIVGDLRLKSRQTSYARLQNMLRNARTPLDFSKQQIQNLRQRNSLTQQLLMTTDSIGSAHISIPVRIASERNKEYILIKNQGESGGWILGVRDDGTYQKPIEIDQEEDNKDESEEASDREMEEVTIPAQTVPDPDLREYQAHMALSAIGNRTQKQFRSTAKEKMKSAPLFDLDENEDKLPPSANMLQYSSEDDEELAFAIQDSFDQKRGPEASRIIDADNSRTLSKTSLSSSRDVYAAHLPPSERLSEEEDLSNSPTRLETVLSIAGAGSSRAHHYSLPSAFGRPVLLSPSQPPSIASLPQAEQDSAVDIPKPPLPESPFSLQHAPVGTMSDFGEEVEVTRSSPVAPTTSVAVEDGTEHTQVVSDSDMDMEEIILERDMNILRSANELNNTPSPINRSTSSLSTVDVRPNAIPSDAPVSQSFDEGEQNDRSWSLSPFRRSSDVDDSPRSRSPSSVQGSWDAAQEMDPHAEEGEFARFISQVKGRNIDDVRREIDDEIKTLNQQKKAAMRDSEDITQQMISQIMIMLRLFGIPYITAPVEAEAQCAELVSLGLVDGVITDDSDVFLFGADCVYKNMFNQSKTVECFLSRDLERELGLERDTLIRLAYLLGSDYVDGLPGVGPVVAMELLKEFPGKDGLHKFKEWWLRVQTGRDREEESNSKFRRQFKRKFKDLYLGNEWPNPAVRDAYYHPTVDSSEEPFKWGSPDLDALRGFFQEELGWGQEKVDGILLPIVQKLNKRNQAAALNKQSDLNSFFDVTAGTGTYTPRNRTAYASKRLQEVINDFRNKRKRNPASPSPLPTPHSRPESASDDDAGPTNKRKKSTRGKGKTRASTSGTRHRQGGRQRGRGTSSRKSRVTPSDNDSDDDEFPASGEEGHPKIPLDPLVMARLRPRPKPSAFKGTHETGDEPGEHSDAVTII